MVQPASADGRSTAPPGGDLPLRDLDFVATDAPLRDDVRRLGVLVGEVIAEQQGQAFFEHVERVRRAAIARREAGAPLDQLVQALPVDDLDAAEAMVRAFSTWFGAVNLAERVHRIRRRRDYQKAGSTAQPGSLQAVVAQLRQAGVDRAELEQALAGLRLMPVFTAHPTEAVRRALLEKEREVVERLVADLDRTRTPQERAVDRERIRMALTAGWQTAELAVERPTVADELEHVGYYLSEVLYRVLPVFHEALDAAIAQAYDPPGSDPARSRTVAFPQLLRFGSWVGGDMDGNPNVGADTIAAALSAQRAQAIAAYRRDLAHLASLLSQSTSRIAVDPALMQRIERYRTLLPSAARRLTPRQQDMPYRVLLRLMSARLAATAGGRSGGYEGADGFVADLEAVGASLRRHAGVHAGWFAVRRVLRRAQAFGFHLATLDLRQDARVHDAALAALFDDPDWSGRSAAERAARLGEALAAPVDPPALDATGDACQRQHRQRIGGAAAHADDERAQGSRPVLAQRRGRGGEHRQHPLGAQR